MQQRRPCENFPWSPGSADRPRHSAEYLAGVADAQADVGPEEN